MPKIIEIGQSLKSYNQLIINILEFNRDFSPHAANKSISQIRNQAAMGAIG